MNLDEKEPRGDCSLRGTNKAHELSNSTGTVHDPQISIAQANDGVNVMLPLVVLFETPNGVENVITILTGAPPELPPNGVSGEFWSGWYSCRKI